MTSPVPVVLKTRGPNQVEIGKVSLLPSSALEDATTAVADLLSSLPVNSPELEAVMSKPDARTKRKLPPKRFLARDIRLEDTMTRMPVKTNSGLQQVFLRWRKAESERVHTLHRLRMGQIEKGFHDQSDAVHVSALLELWHALSVPETRPLVSDSLIHQMLKVALHSDALDVLGLSAAVLWTLWTIDHHARHQPTSTFNQAKLHLQSSQHAPTQVAVHVLLRAVHKLCSVKRDEVTEAEELDRWDFGKESDPGASNPLNPTNSSKFDDARFEAAFRSLKRNSISSLYGDPLLFWMSRSRRSSIDSVAAAEAAPSDARSSSFDGWSGINAVGETGDWRPKLFTYGGSSEIELTVLASSKRVDLAALLKPQSLLWALSSLQAVLRLERAGALRALLSAAKEIEGCGCGGVEVLVPLLKEVNPQTCRIVLNLLFMVASGSEEACDSLLEGWSWQLIYFIGGWSNESVQSSVQLDGFELRVQASALLTLAVTKSSQSQSWKTLAATCDWAQLLGALRAITSPLFRDFNPHHMAADPIRAGRAVTLLTAVVGAQWAICKGLALAGTPLKASPQWLCYALRLINIDTDEADACADQSATTAPPPLRKRRRDTLRTAGMGLLATVDLGYIEVMQSRGRGWRRQNQKVVNREGESKGYQETTMNFQFADACAIWLQSLWRGSRTRRYLAKQTRAATKVQACWRGQRTRNRLHQQRTPFVAVVSSGMQTYLRRQRKSRRRLLKSAGGVEKMSVMSDFVGERAQRIRTLRRLCSRLLDDIDQLTAVASPSRAVSCTSAAVCYLTQALMQTLRSTGLSEPSLPSLLLRMISLCRRFRSCEMQTVDSLPPEPPAAADTSDDDVLQDDAPTSPKKSAQPDLSNEQPFESISEEARDTSNSATCGWALTGFKASSHAYLAAAVVTILKHILEEVLTESAKAQGQRPPRNSRRSLRESQDQMVRQALIVQALAPEALAVLVGMLSSSAFGAAQGCVAMWMAVHFGKSSTLVQLGAVEGLVHALRQSTKDLSPNSPSYVDARWACHALWSLLASEPLSRPRGLAAGGDMLVQLTRALSVGDRALTIQKEVQLQPIYKRVPSHEEREMIAQHEGLRKGLIGCLGSLMLDSSLFTDLCRIRIPHTLRELALCDWVHPRDRMAALRAVDFVAVSLCQHEEGGEEILVNVLMALLDDQEREMQCLACRMLGRIAMGNGERLVVEIGGVEALIRLVRCAVEEATPCAAILLRDSLNAVLNLSCAKHSQERIAKCGLQTLVHLWFKLSQPVQPKKRAMGLFDSLSFQAGLGNEEVTVQEILDLTCGILDNLSRNPSLHTPIYRAELRLKSAAWIGQTVGAKGRRVFQPVPTEVHGHSDRGEELGKLQPLPNAGMKEKDRTMTSSMRSSGSAARLRHAVAASRDPPGSELPFSQKTGPRSTVLRSRHLASSLAEQRRPNSRGGASSASAPSLNSMLRSNKRWELQPPHRPTSATSPRSPQLGLLDARALSHNACSDPRALALSPPMRELDSPDLGPQHFEMEGERLLGASNLVFDVKDSTISPQSVHHSTDSPRVDRWRPAVLDVKEVSSDAGDNKTVHERVIELAAMEPSDDEQDGAVKHYLEQYMQAHRPLRFAVSLPPSQVHTPTFKFTTPNEVSEKQLARTMMDDSLVGWEGASGSKVGELYPSFPLPDGRLVRLYHTSVQRNWRAPRREPHDLLPKSFAQLDLPTLSAPPSPGPLKNKLPNIAMEHILSCPEPPVRAAPRRTQLLQRSVVLIVEWEESRTKSSFRQAEPSLPTATEFNFAQEEVTKVEAKIDPFDLL